MESFVSSHRQVERDRFAALVASANTLSSCALFLLNSLVACSGTDRGPFTADFAPGDGGAKSPLDQPAQMSSQQGPAIDASSGDMTTPSALADACSAPEVCNGLDDNCNGIIDEGCPIALSIGAPAGQVVLGASTGGMNFDDACGQDEVLAGLEALAGAWLDHVRGVCRHFELAVDKTAPRYRYRLKSSGTTRALALHPTTTTTPNLTAFVCPDDRVMVGLRVSQQAYSTFLVMPKIWVICAELTFDTDTGDAPRGSWQNAFELGPLSGYYVSDAGESVLASNAPEGRSVPVKLVGSSGDWMDRIGYGLAELSVARATNATGR